VGLFYTAPEPTRGATFGAKKRKINMSQSNVTHSSLGPWTMWTPVHWPNLKAVWRFYMKLKTMWSGWILWRLQHSRTNSTVDKDVEKHKKNCPDHIGFYQDNSSVAIQKRNKTKTSKFNKLKSNLISLVTSDKENKTTVFHTLNTLSNTISYCTSITGHELNTFRTIVIIKYETQCCIGY